MFRFLTQIFVAALPCPSPGNSCFLHNPPVCLARCACIGRLSIAGDRGALPPTGYHTTKRQVRPSVTQLKKCFLGFLIYNFSPIRSVFIETAMLLRKNRTVRDVFVVRSRSLGVSPRGNVVGIECRAYSSHLESDVIPSSGPGALASFLIIRGNRCGSR